VNSPRRGREIVAKFLPKKPRAAFRARRAIAIRACLVVRRVSEKHSSMHFVSRLRQSEADRGGLFAVRENFPPVAEKDAIMIAPGTPLPGKNILR